VRAGARREYKEYEEVRKHEEFQVIKEAGEFNIHGEGKI
jgi:hypothetical protein